MTIQVFSHQRNIEELVSQIMLSRRISRSDHQKLVSVASKYVLGEEEQALIDRIFYGVRHGLLQVVE